MLATSLILSVSMSGVVGVVPDAISDRYARLLHNYTGPDCGLLAAEFKPPACQAGTDDAQATASWSHVGFSVFGLLINPVMGSVSDLHGRRIVILASLVVSCISSLLFLQTISTPHMSPSWYYLSQSALGGFQYIGFVLAALADMTTDECRAGIFGVFVAVLYAGYAVGPSVTVWFDHENAAKFCAGASAANLCLAILFFPETLSPRNRTSNRQRREFNTAARLGEPMGEVSILNMDWTMRLLASGTLISSMVFAGDVTYTLFYAEDRFDFGDKDIAVLFVFVGVSGFLLQGVALQPLVQFMGERAVLVVTFASGMVHNFLYGVARNKQTIFFAVVLSQLTKVNLPVLTSFASKKVDEAEQGRLQGALSACTAIGAAAGPLSMQFIYHQTKNIPIYGPGCMFLYAAALYGLGSGLMFLLPENERRLEAEDADELLAEPLLQEDSS